jgi:hypothetical protein
MLPIIITIAISPAAAVALTLFAAFDARKRPRA